MGDADATAAAASALGQLREYLGTSALKGHTGQPLRSAIGALQRDTLAFDDLAGVLCERAASLQHAASAMSLALHEFSTAVVALTGTPKGPMVATPSMHSSATPSFFAPEERAALLDTADAMNMLGASMQGVEEALRVGLSQPLQGLRASVATSFQSALAEAADTRLELESEGKKTAVQMSKKHQQAERRSSDVSFGDLLKIQQSLKTVEKRFEGAATSHLATMLDLRAARRSAVTRGILQLQSTMGTILEQSSVRLAKSQDRAAPLVAALTLFAVEWEREAATREAEVARAINDSCYGTSTHMEGYLAVVDRKTSEKKYFVAAHGKLTQYAHWGSYAFENEWDLLLFTVRPAEASPLAFEVQSPMVSMTFEAPTEAKRNKWLQVLAENISARLDAQKHEGTKSNPQDEQKKKEILDAIRALPGNAVCADCDAADPTWASLNMGVLICHQCSGVHRKLGAHVSKVRSLTLDVIDQELFQYLLSFGNATVNAHLEARLSRKKPSGASKREVREDFITSKYAARAFATVDARESAAQSEALWKGLDAGEVGSQELLLAIVTGADLRWADPATGKTLVHAALESQAVRTDPLVLTQLLVYNDAPVDVASSAANWRPLHVAASRNFVETCRVLIRNSADVHAVTADGKTALELLDPVAHPTKAEAMDLEHYFFPATERSRRRSESVAGTPLSASGKLRTSSVTEADVSPSVGRKGGRRLSLFGRSKGSPTSGGSSPTVQKKRHSAANIAKRLAGGGEDE